MRRLRALLLGGLLSAALVVPLVGAPQAEAHGWVTNPPSRQDHCYTGKMTNCGGIQYEPQSVEAPKGSMQCNGGSAAFTVLNDESRNWPVANIGSTVTIQWKLTAAHNTSLWEYFVDGKLHQTFDQRGAQPPSNISHTLTNLPAGKHKILARWNISNTINAFYNCIDVNVSGGGGPGPTPTPTQTSPSPTPTPTHSDGGDECHALPWRANVAYVGGVVVSHDGNDYKAKWWTQGDNPATNSGSSGVWQNLGPCEGHGDHPGPTPTPTQSQSPTPTPTQSQSPTPTPTQSQSPTPTPTQTGGPICDAPAWKANTNYVPGDVVSHKGSIWESTWWSNVEPGGPHSYNTWKDLGPCSGNGGPSPTPTPTQSQSPTPTPTQSQSPTPTPTQSQSPTPTPTQTGGPVCDAPAWSASAVYTGGEKVSHQGNLYEAKWWTQGDNPAQAGEWGVWANLGPCSPGTSPSPTGSQSPTPTQSQSPTPTPTISPGPGDPNARVVGYFIQWGTYGRNYNVKDVVTSGSAEKLTHILYAFGNVQNGRCTIGDGYADYEKAFTAEQSVDGVADKWDDALRGNFGQLKKLKAMYPNIKVLFSIGGWTWSGGFGQAANNPAAFADSCYQMLNDPRWAGVFDGIDLDWEYPNACGLTCDTSGYDSLTRVTQAMRAKFGNKLVTAAITADGTSGGKIDAADYAGATKHLDFLMPMTYDFQGAWDAKGPVAPHSPLFGYEGQPTKGFDTATTMAKLKGLGIPSEKILIGIGFYGRGWTGVTSSAVGSPAFQAAQGTYEAGIEDYKVLKNTCPSTGTVGGTAYAYCNGNWWGYDTPATINSKMQWAKQENLGGAFFWELSGDTSNGELITSLYNGLRK